MPLAKQPKNTSIYEVTASDTLARISLRFDTTPSELSRLNHLSTTLLYPGQSLFVPNPHAEDNNSDDNATPRGDEGNETAAETETLAVASDTNAAFEFSPDLNLCRLLNQEENNNNNTSTNTTVDEISRQYLKLSSQHIIEDGATVSGVLLVTPQTLMFNPCFSDHMVMEHGWDAYCIRLPLRTISRVFLFKDETAMMEGDLSKQYTPTVCFLDYSSPKFNISAIQETKKVMKQIHENCDHETEGHKRINDRLVEKALLELAMKEVNSPKQERLDKKVSHLKDRATTSVQHSEPEMVSSTECTSCHNFTEFIEASTPKATKKIADIIEFPMKLAGAIINKRRSFKDSFEDSDSSSSGQQSIASSRTASVDVVDQNDDGGDKNPAIRNKAVDRPISMSDDVFCHGDTQREPTKDSPVESKNDSSPAESKNNHTGEPKHDDQYTKEQPMSKDGNSDGTDTNTEEVEDDQSTTEGENLEQCKEISSRDKIVPEITIVLDADGIMKDIDGDVSKDSGISVSTTGATKTSSLTEEERRWLGKRGVRLSIDKREVFPTNSPSDEPEGEEEGEEAPPKEGGIDENLLMYVVLRVQKAFHYQNLRKQKKIYASNFCQPNLEYCFAVPRERADQFYNFLLYWLPDVYGEDSSGFSTPCSIECEYFEEKAKIRRNWSQYSGSSRSSVRSLSEDEIPELDEESQILSQKQVHLLSRKLPYRTVGHRWELVYSTMVHGISLKTLYQNFKYHDCPVLIAIKDENLQVFGAFISEPPRISDGFYGTGESMLYTFESDTKLKTFNWTGQNTFIVKGSKNSLAIGDGDGVFGLWLDGDLNHGRTNTCNTFENDQLTNKEDFICCGLEAWGFV